MSGQAEAQPHAHRQSEQSIYPLVCRWAERTPEAIALTAPGCPPVTYKSLRIHIEDTVQTLNGMGVGRGDRVAIVLPNGPEMALVFLAWTALHGTEALIPAPPPRARGGP